MQDVGPAEGDATQSNAKLYIVITVVGVLCMHHLRMRPMMVCVGEMHSTRMLQ